MTKKKRFDSFIIWPLLLCLTLALICARSLIDILTNYKPILTDSVIWEKLTVEGVDPILYDPNIGNFILFEVIGQAVLAIFAVILLIIYFMKARIFLKLAHYFFVLFALYIGIDLYFYFQIPRFSAIGLRMADYENIMLAVMGVLLWIPFLKVSEQMKQRFSPEDANKSTT